jgi:hypothetical protein
MVTWVGRVVAAICCVEFSKWERTGDLCDRSWTLTHFEISQKEFAETAVIAVRLGSDGGGDERGNSASAESEQDLVIWRVSAAGPP